MIVSAICAGSPRRDTVRAVLKLWDDQRESERSLEKAGIYFMVLKMPMKKKRKNELDYSYRK